MKDLGNYVRYDLSEMEEIRRKRANLIWRVNGILDKYQDVIQETKMYILYNSYGCYLYGYQARCYSDQNIEFIVIELKQNSYKDLESSL